MKVNKVNKAKVNKQTKQNKNKAFVKLYEDDIHANVSNLS